MQDINTVRAAALRKIAVDPDAWLGHAGLTPEELQAVRNSLAELARQKDPGKDHQWHGQFNPSGPAPAAPGAAAANPASAYERWDGDTGKIPYMRPIDAGVDVATGAALDRLSKTMKMAESSFRDISSAADSGRQSRRSGRQ